MIRRAGRAAVAAFAATLSAFATGLSSHAAPPPALDPATEPTSDPPHDTPADAAAARWLEEVAPLITPAERAAYLALSRPYQRAAFELRFWEVRDPFPATAVNEFAERWRERVAVARERWGTLDDARSLAFALAGAPYSVIALTCLDLLRPGEIWRYSGSGPARDSVVVFLAEGLSPKSRHRIWRPEEGFPSLTTGAGAGVLDANELLERIAVDCGRGSEIASLLTIADDWQDAIDRRLLLPHANDEWLLGFSAHSTDLPADLPADRAPLAATLEIRFPGRRGLRTLVQGAIRLDETPAVDSAFTLEGEIVRDDELFDRFRYRFQAPPGEAPAFLFDRPLRPGGYRLVVRLRDVAADRYFREERALLVPFDPEHVEDRVAAAITPPSPSDAAATPPGQSSPVTPSLSSAQRAGLATPLPVEPEVRLRISTAKLVTGKLRLDADVQGEAIVSVAFALDGKLMLTKRRPPFGVELDLGRAPRLHSVGAIAYDSAGRELARDEELLNGGPHRFALRLREPHTIPEGAEWVTARAELDLPEGEQLERVEFYVNNQLYATLFQPPFEQSLPVPAGSDPSWIRAVGHLVGGGAAEDVRLVGSAEYSSAVDVDFVEIHASIVDRRGRTIEDVRPDEVRLEESGQEQAIQRFELQRDLPIHAALLLDTSSSMVIALQEAERAALRFFEEVLTDRDRAAVITFADEPRLAVRFTRSVEVLSGGLAGLEADGDTKLWDALAFALHYFSGIRGKRAMVLLSDGVDSKSDFAFADVLEYAQRTGVAIYAIGMNVPSNPPDAGICLDQLARKTGGRSYRIERAVELGPIYKTIERELRAQYLISYQSSNPEREGFRPIELEVRRPGAKVATVAGYYP